jgi:predicted alpha/beta-fold hydrolase
MDSIFKNFKANMLLYLNPLLANIYMGKVQEEYFPNGYEREYLEIKEDSAVITLDWAKDEVSGKVPEHSKTLIIIHGLTGASESGYIKRACRRAILEGFIPVVVQKRGYNSTRMTSPRLTPPDSFVDFIESTKHIM